jgi:hypothetical protein
MNRAIESLGNFLEKLSMDFIGPIISNFDGYKFIILTIDRFSRFRWVKKSKTMPKNCISNKDNRRHHDGKNEYHNW